LGEQAEKVKLTMRARMSSTKLNFEHNLCTASGEDQRYNCACGHPSFAFLDLFLLRKTAISLRDITVRLYTIGYDARFNDTVFHLTDSYKQIQHLRHIIASLPILTSFLHVQHITTRDLALLHEFILMTWLAR